MERIQRFAEDTSFNAVRSTPTKNAALKTVKRRAVPSMIGWHVWLLIGCYVVIGCDGVVAVGGLLYIPPPPPTMCRHGVVVAAPPTSHSSNNNNNTINTVPTHCWWWLMLLLEEVDVAVGGVWVWVVVELVLVLVLKASRPEGGEQVDNDSSNDVVHLTIIGRYM
eukprot:scaffold2730_cov76-Skeletonema_dohrnii-CCMP3373.AAC.3